MHPDFLRLLRPLGGELILTGQRWKQGNQLGENALAQEGDDDNRVGCRSGRRENSESDVLEES